MHFGIDVKVDKAMKYLLSFTWRVYIPNQQIMLHIHADAAYILYTLELLQYKERIGRNADMLYGVQPIEFYIDPGEAYVYTCQQLD